MSRECIKSDTSEVYIVKHGDSLMSIAAQYGNITPTQLARFNRVGMLGVVHPHLFPGQILRIPNELEFSKQFYRMRNFPGSAARVLETPKLKVEAYNISGSVLQEKDTSFLDTQLLKTDKALLNKVKLSQPLFEPNTQQPCVQERLFVKIKAQRIMLPSKLPIDGILIVTPNSVCFDALETALAINKMRESRTGVIGRFQSEDTPLSSAAPLAAFNPETTNGRPKINASSAAFNCTDQPLHDVLSLSVCIPILALISLNTHRSLDELLFEGMQRSDSLKQPVMVESYYSLNNRNTFRSDHFRDVTERTASSIFVPTSSTKGPKYEVNPTLLSSEDTLPVAQTHQYKLHEGSRLGDPSRAIKAASCDCRVGEVPCINEVYVSLGVDVSRIKGLGQYTDMSLAEAATSAVHVFQLPIECLGDIFDILISAKNYAEASKLTTTLRSQSQLSKSFRASKPPSLIETVLEEMKHSSPEIILKEGTSKILIGPMLYDLSVSLPPFCAFPAMKLVFSSFCDGYSLSNLYRKNETVQGFVTLLIRDTTGTTFGAILSEGLRLSPHFYGTGESCLFHWSPHFKRYDWTRKNYYLMRGAPDCFFIGAKSGHNAIWFDDALRNGRSEATDTYDNPALCGTDQTAALTGSPTSDPAGLLLNSIPFIIDQLEVWEFIT